MSNCRKGGDNLSSPLLVETIGGKQRLNCANARGLLRIIRLSLPQSRADQTSENYLPEKAKSEKLPKNKN